MVATPTKPTFTQVETSTQGKTSTQVKMFTLVHTYIESLAPEIRNYTDSHVDNVSIEDFRISVKRTGNALESFTGDIVLFQKLSVISASTTTTSKSTIFWNWLLEGNLFSILFIFLSGEIMI